MLEDRDLSLAEIASRVGYESEASFSRAFDREEDSHRASSGQASRKRKGRPFASAILSRVPEYC